MQAQVLPELVEPLAQVLALVQVLLERLVQEQQAQPELVLALAESCNSLAVAQVNCPL